MGWDSVPWAVGGGAVHSSEIARLVTFLATGGREGVFGATDLKVTPLAVPGEGVLIAAGACAIRNRASGTAYDSYVARMPTQDEVDTTPNGPSAPRSDLVVARIENPYLAGEPWSVPLNIETGPYVYTRVIENVADTTKNVASLDLGYSAIALARIDFPINTGTVTAGMIKDLRSVINPAALTPSVAPDADDEYGGEPMNFKMVLVPNTVDDVIDYTQLTFHDFPDSANWQVRFPTWATYTEFDIRLQNVFIRDGNAWGEIRLLINGVVAATSNYDFNFWEGDPHKAIFTVGGGYVVPEEIRGKKVTCKLQVKYYDEYRNVNGSMHADLTSYTSGLMVHYCRPV